MTIDTPTASLIGAFVGALSGLGGVLVSTWLSRRSEERKHLREIAVSTAIKEWERMHVDSARMHEQGVKVLMPPVDVYILHKVLLMEAIMKYGSNEVKMGNELTRIQKLVDGVTNRLKIAGVD